MDHPLTLIEEYDTIVSELNPDLVKYVVMGRMTWEQLKGTGGIFLTRDGPCFHYGYHNGKETMIPIVVKQSFDYGVWAVYEETQTLSDMP